jgi:hypothetical protein
VPHGARWRRLQDLLGPHAHTGGHTGRDRSNRGGGGSGCLHAASRTHGREAREGLREVAQAVQRVDVGRVAVLHQALGVQPHLVAAPDAVVSSSSSSSASASASTCNCHSLGTAR